MKINSLIEKNTGIVCTCKKDLDKIIRIASKKKWHWINGYSALSWQVPAWIVNKVNSPRHLIVSFVTSDINKNGMGFGFQFEYQKLGDKDINWFVRNFTPRPRKNKNYR